MVFHMSQLTTLKSQSGWYPPNSNHERIMDIDEENTEAMELSTFNLSDMQGTTSAPSPSKRKTKEVNVEGKKEADDAMQEGWQKSSRECNARRRKRATVVCSETLVEI
ncbi:hypothetical protein DVH24_006915 [Malus domestica]|uniref:Uncharacterized protein n=1 Tax=Malus domestica TaxID=3750 RepID=A0A498J642_MALDO|nr:hypothetical protein DVH24_006915 [Malus domestica]